MQQRDRKRKQGAVFFGKSCFPAQNIGGNAAFWMRRCLFFWEV